MSDSSAREAGPGADLGRCVFDASVFLNAFRPSEEGHRVSRLLLEATWRGGTPLLAPTLLKAEIAAALARWEGAASLTPRFLRVLSHAPILWVPLDEVMGDAAARLATRARVRGADAVYGAVAERFDAVLVTRDRQQKERLADLIDTRHPADLAANPGSSKGEDRSTE